MIDVNDYIWLILLKVLNKKTLEIIAVPWKSSLKSPAERIPPVDTLQTRQCKYFSRFAGRSLSD